MTHPHRQRLVKVLNTELTKKGKRLGLKDLKRRVKAARQSLERVKAQTFGTLYGGNSSLREIDWATHKRREAHYTLAVARQEVIERLKEIAQ